MMNLENIVAFSALNGFPPHRERQAMAEYLQCLILQSVARHSLPGKMSFIGGTSLRFFYNLPRFSEDLDFDNFGLSVHDFEHIIAAVVADLSLQGFVVDSVVRIKGAYHCYIRFNNLLFENRLSPHADEKILVKIDTALQDFSVQTEKKFFNRYSIVEEVVVNPAEILMAQKTIALLERSTPKGRDFFDFIFLDGFTKPSIAYLKHKIGIGGLLELKEAVLKRCAPLDFDALAKDVAPFIFNPNDIIRITKFRDYIAGWPAA